MAYLCKSHILPWLLLLVTVSQGLRDPETRNPPVTPYGEKLIDGDMILSEEQLQFFYGDGKVSMRKGTSIKNMLWPEGIVYYKIHLTSNKERPVIEGAMQLWMNHTCLTFKEVTGPYEEPHLIIMKKTGCWSDVGRKFWHNGQELSIGYGCGTIGTVAHEIGHAIGFHHEQSRPDRDNYIKIFSEHYDKEKNDNFKKQTYVNNYSVPYDYDSIMHYSMYAFSNDDQKTIAPHDPTKQFLLGQRDHLSFYDRKLANIMYNCDSTCNSKVECLNEGYVDSSCKCQCKEEFSGDRCQNHVPPESVCGGRITEETIIKSPNYPKPYGSDKKCIWWIQAPEGRKVKINFDDFDLRQREDDAKNDCYWDKLEVRNKDVYNGKEYCGQELKGKGFTSQSNDMVLVFQSKLIYNTGFLIQVQFV